MGWILDRLGSLIERLAKDRVEAAAKELAVKREMLRATVRCYVHILSTRRKLDPERAEGVTNAVYRQLEPLIKEGVADDFILEQLNQRIVDAIAIKTVSLSTWIMLSILDTIGAVPHEAVIGIKYRSGSTSTEATSRIAGLQSEFEFHQPFACDARTFTVTPEMSALAKQALTSQAFTMMQQSIDSSNGSVTIVATSPSDSMEASRGAVSPNGGTFDPDGRHGVPSPSLQEEVAA